jgi:nitric oxide reductase NorD protein
MAEAEDVIVDAARHATSYAQALLRRRRAVQGAPVLGVLDAAPRLDLLLTAVHQAQWTLRVAQPPPPVTLLARWFKRSGRPWRTGSVPACDGAAIWLPRELTGLSRQAAWPVYRAIALQQAQRARLRGAPGAPRLEPGLVRDIYLVLEGLAADGGVLHALPGMHAAITALRAEALARRPVLGAFPECRRPLERWYRGVLAGQPVAMQAATPEQRVQEARALAAGWPMDPVEEPLFKDWWTGEWPTRNGLASIGMSGAGAPAQVDPADDARPVRSARLARRPEIREAEPDEDDARPGAWMVQTAQPHESAEDPMGLQRPSDRDADEAAEAHAESVSELPQARLIRSPQRAHEVLLSDDLPAFARPTPGTADVSADRRAIPYPEWDWHLGAYRDPGVLVWESTGLPGAPEWVAKTMRARQGLLASIRQRFEMLRADRVHLHRQEEGDDLDLEACIEGRADLRAGASMSQKLYRTTRLARRDTAVMVLVDSSGSTDAWVAGNLRIIDVEREALLLLSAALDATGDPHAILAFSGEGPQHVAVRRIKHFDERHGDAVALRIAGLEPERYTRAGAALRHASALLSRQPARHRLLLLLSDGKPNDQDQYEGRYGVEDMRQAVREARQAGQSPFCLTVDRQAASYLPAVFGPHHYALLQQPERLPMALLDWMKRLLVA